MNQEQFTSKHHSMINKLNDISTVVILNGEHTTFKDIALEMNIEYLNIRLPMCDNNDLGLHPMKCTPNWAIHANQQPTLICFEDFHRANTVLGDEVLRILTERTFGEDFKFNDNVLMCVCGEDITIEDTGYLSLFKNTIITKI